MPPPPGPILLTGANGLLGQAVVNELNRRRIDCIAVDRNTCDITDPAATDALLDRHKPAVLLNCAAYTAVDAAEINPAAAHAVNATAVAHLAKRAKDTGVKLIHLSTDFVFDGQKKSPYQPDDPPNPLSVYGQSKLAGEQAVQQTNPPGWLIVRTAWLFGPGGKCFPRTIIDAVRAGQTPKVVNDQSGNPTHAPDLANALIDAIEQNTTGLHHIVNTGPTTWHDFAVAILKAFNITGQITPITTAQWQALRPHAAPRPQSAILHPTRPLRPWQQALNDFAQAN